MGVGILSQWQLTKMTTYKIGDEVLTKYVPPLTSETIPYFIGQAVDMFDKGTHDKVATFKVIEENGVDIKGRVINTYGHKRRK